MRRDTPAAREKYRLLRATPGTKEKIYVRLFLLPKKKI